MSPIGGGPSVQGFHKKSGLVFGRSSFTLCRGKVGADPTDPAFAYVYRYRPGTTTGPWPAPATYDSALERYRRAANRATSSACSKSSACSAKASRRPASNQVLVARYESPPYDLRSGAGLGISRDCRINLAGVPVFGAIASSRSPQLQRPAAIRSSTPRPGSDAHWSKPRHSRHCNIYFREDLIEELADGRTAQLSPDARCSMSTCAAIKAVDRTRWNFPSGEPGPFAHDGLSGPGALDRRQADMRP